MSQKKVKKDQILFRMDKDKTTQEVKITPMKVLSVGKKYFQIEGMKRKYQIEDLMYMGFGYHVLYLTEQEIWDKLDEERIGEKIRLLFRGFGKLYCPIDKLRRIEAILDEPEEKPELKMNIDE